MNVLVYLGPETLQQSLNDTTTTLRSILLPHYSVQTISQNHLITQPWSISCALLVLPRCTARLNPQASDSIKKYVDTGGSLLAFSAGVVTALRDQIEGSKDFLLGFYHDDARKHMHLTFHPPGDEALSPRTVTLRTPEGDLIERIRDTGLVSIVGFGSSQTNARVLASYDDGVVAGVQCRIGRGKIIVWAPSLESPLTAEGSASSIVSTAVRSIPSEERRRLYLLRNGLISLPPASPEEQKPVSHPLPQFLSSSPLSSFKIVSEVADSIAAPSPGSQLSVFKDNNDTFHFHHLAKSDELLKTTRETVPASTDPAQWQPKHIILCSDALPTRDQTPLFDLHLYYTSLSQARQIQHLPAEPASRDAWGLGEALLYGEVVTSTQTMLDRNPRLLSRLPPPFVALASYQLAGRGRGANIWLSPPGSLLFSVVLRVSSLQFPASKLVFVQYLFALAVAEACREESVLGPGRGKRVRVKWPNDLYAVVGSGGGGEEEQRKKVGGILVNTSFGGGKIDIVIGCGLNVLNEEPIFSLAQLLPPDQRHALSVERTLATILAHFEKMWNRFIADRGSFYSFMDLYLERWLHSDQLVTLTTLSPPKRVRIVGLTSDHGLLRTVLAESGGGGGFVDLQPDGNSFDMMAGLIKTKT